MDESATNTVGYRLKIFREFKELTQIQLAGQLEMSTTGLQSNEGNRSLPNSKLLIGLASLGLNIHWLLLGEETMLRADMHMPASMDVDLNLVGECVELLELALNKFNRQLSPEKKRAAVEAMYRAHQGKKGVDQGLVDMIIKLAA